MDESKCIRANSESATVNDKKHTCGALMTSSSLSLPIFRPTVLAMRWYDRTFFAAFPESGDRLHN